MMNQLLAVAPMLDYTDRHCRYFFRLISRQIVLYTEMLTTWAILQGRREALLAYNPSEQPVILQLGGCNPSALAECAKIGEDYGYDGINLNVGCPSDRVQAARFGACLMAEPKLVADCIATMQQAVRIPVTVKTRIGIDDRDGYDELAQFIETIAKAGCVEFILHARKAWLKGLSPKENREIPPLRYDVVYQIKKDFPQLKIIINGGIVDLDQTRAHLLKVDGVMIGRAFYHDPYSFIEVDNSIYGASESLLSRHEIMERFFPYVVHQLEQGVPLSCMTRHVLGLFQGQPGARAWRRHLSEHAPRAGAGIEVLKKALEKIER